MPNPILHAAFILYRRLLSPAIHSLGVSNCIYLPTCSEYAEIAIDRHGLLKGSAMAAARIARCNPLAKGGLDPVPEHPTQRQEHDKCA